MFKTVKRIIDWCGEFKEKLYLGFIFSFFSYWFAAMPVMVAAYTIGMLLDAGRGAGTFDRAWIWKSLVIMGVFVFLRFLFDYLRARCQEAISYELIARDRLAVGDALKRVSLGYFAQMNTGNILNSITTGLGTLESMGIRMIDNFVGGYLNFLCIFLFLLFFNPVVSLIALAGAFASFLCLLLVSKHSVKHAPAEAEAGRNLAGAVLEYARGISVVKSFGKSGASMEAMQKACRDSRDIRLAIEWGFTPANCLHLLALKCASVALAAEACFLGFRGEMEFPVMLMFVFFSFGIFGSLEPISDSAHVLGVIDEAMDQLDELKQDHFIDENGMDIPLTNYDIAFSDVSFGYDSRTILKGVSFRIPEHTTTAIVGSSGSGKTTICNLLARFYDVNSGSIRVSGTDIRDVTRASLRGSYGMVLQDTWLRAGTVRENIAYGKPDATMDEVIAAAKAAHAHSFIRRLPDGYDTVIAEDGGNISQGQKQLLCIARVMLCLPPMLILDEATSSIDTRTEVRIQKAFARMMQGRTSFIVAHRLSTIREADVILVMKDGHIVEQGNHDQLLAQGGFYAKLYNSQFEGVQT